MGTSALSRVESDEEEFHSFSGHEPDGGEDEDAESVMEPPVHPMPSLQGAFEESILESTEADGSSSSFNSDAEARRKKLLEAHQYDDSWTTRWKQKPGARHHPLLKLMAQIVFGMHLLQQGQAKSNEEVVRILQTHVNEVDTFLERTSEDFGLAIADIEERIRHLKLPMEHLEVFNAMLDDKKFRTQLLNGNDNIEKIIDRTAKAMNAALMDVRKGLQATHELGKYLDGIKEQWPRENNGIAEVFGAMHGNEQGWKKYLKDLQAKGNNLGNHLIQLGTVIGEMSKLAAAASRRGAPQSRAKSPSRSTRSLPASPGLRSKFARDDAEPMPTIALALNKPLPKEPDTAAGASRMTVPKLHPIPFAQRYEQPRQSPQSPPSNSRRVSAMPNGTPPRPRTAGAPRDARMSSSGTSDLADFLKHSGPLRSNPPEPGAVGGKGEPGLLERRANRSRSQGANELLNAVATAEAPARSKSHGAAVILTSQSNNRDAKSRPSSRGADKALTSDYAPAARKDSVASTGFARRISHRLKHIQPPDGHPPDATTIPGFPAPPTDSAYSSGTERNPRTPAARPSTAAPTTTTATATAPASASAPAPITPVPATVPPTSPHPEEPSPRPPSRLGLFPRADEPLTPSAASMRSHTTASHRTPDPKVVPPDDRASLVAASSPGSSQQPFEGESDDESKEFFPSEAGESDARVRCEVRGLAGFVCSGLYRF
ncbi:hypothetical protein B0A55_04760 [Friedmanniomyces simplex]|uniref:Uncharacterized protein n=1 Tax=Friedmanniomyces simplex TaxID=329884 RepID=A0A4U0XLS3_9PEZI|nr:hypothetical protein B0A55_04760 [Friedmanniomyces simplex]